MNQDSLRIVIADDSPLTRHVLVQLIGAQPDMQVVGEASTGHDAVRLATDQQPDIVLMDIHMPGLDGLQAAWLVSGRVPRGAVIMVTSEQRQDFLDRAVAAGAKGYVLKPFGDGAELLEMIRRVHREATEQRTRLRASGDDGADLAAEPPSVGRTIAIVGSKGGVGRTTIAVGLALALQQHGRTALMDADFMFGDTAIHLDIATQHSIVDLVPYADSLESFTLSQVMDEHVSGVHVLARPLRPEQADVLTPALVRSVVAVLANLYDFVVVDTQLSYDERMLAVLDQADVYLMVLSGQLGALRNTRHFLDVARMVGYPEDRMCFVLNRSDALGGFTIDDVTSVVETRRILQIPNAGEALSRAINVGAPLTLTAPDSPFTRAMANLAEHVRVLASSRQPRALTE